jgi:hypothetical protein
MPRKTTRKRAKSKQRTILNFSWPAVVFFLLCVGIMLAGWTFLASAADITVRAKVSAPLPTGPATIDTPTNGRHFSHVPVTVSGTCPSDGSGAYINLYRNDVFSGSAICDGGQQYSLSTDLFPGANKLKAVIYNKTDDPGPDSNTPIVYYDVPVPPSPPPSQPPAPSKPSGQSTQPLTITSDFKFIGYSVGQTVRWKLAIGGGTSPYAINVDWGDGKNSVVSLKGAGEFTIEHSYDKPGGYKGSYPIVVTAGDAVGDQSLLQLFVLVNSEGTGPIAGTTIKPPPLAPTKNWLKWIWPTYAIVSLMALSYLLGEREELLMLKKRNRLRQRAA